MITEAWLCVCVCECECVCVCVCVHGCLHNWITTRACSNASLLVLAYIIWMFWWLSQPVFSCCHNVAVQKLTVIELLYCLCVCVCVCVRARAHVYVCITLCCELSVTCLNLFNLRISTQNKSYSHGMRRHHLGKEKAEGSRGLQKVQVLL